MIYSVRHTTIFHYQPAVRESVMEVRMQPRNEGRQRCLNFNLDITPAANITQYRDFTGNTVHHFDIARSHFELKVVAQSTVQVQEAPAPRPDEAGDWADLDAITADSTTNSTTDNDHWEMLLPSQFAHSGEALKQLAEELQCERRASPLELLTEINEGIYRLFSYVPNSTKVDSPIEDALQSRQGVCQDFAHIMTALLRPLGIPCRYVSGYLFHRETEDGRRDRSLEGASHAWVEALVPRLGWTPFDPTNNLIGGDRHIRVAIGRDYADVPPTRGVYKGGASSGLSVAVTVSPSDAIPPDQPAPYIVIQPRPVFSRYATRSDQEQQQQQ
jgi:transglutaminase-like putative cysteine protease